MKYCCIGALVLILAFSLSSAERPLFPVVATAANGRSQSMAFIAPPLALGIEVRPRWIERKQDRQQTIERHPTCIEIQERFLHILRAYQRTHLINTSAR